MNSSDRNKAYDNLLKSLAHFMTSFSRKTKTKEIKKIVQKKTEIVRKIIQKEK